MDMSQPPYTSYLLRLWPTRSGAEWVWMASLENPHSGERQGFPDLQELFTYLEEKTGQDGLVWGVYPATEV